MSSYKFDEDAEKQDVPDLAQHAEFHFKDADVEDVVTRARRERLETEERAIEAKRLAGLPLASTVENETTPADALKLDEPWVAPTPVAPSPASAPVHAQTQDAEELNEDFLVWPDIPPEAAAPTPPQPTPAAPATPAAITSAAAPRMKAPDTSGPRPRAASQSAAQAAAAQAAAQATPQATSAARTAAKAAPRQSAAGAQAPGATPAARPAAQAPARPMGAAAVPKPAAPAAAPAAAETIETDALHIVPRFDVRRAIDKFDPIAMLVAQIAAVAMVISLGYILWGVFGGSIGQANSANAAQAAANIAIAAKVFRFGAVALALSSILLMLDESSLGPGLAITGIALHFGSAPLLATLGSSKAILHLIENARSLGFALLVLGVLKGTVDLIRWIIDRPNRMRAGATVGSKAKLDAKQLRIAATSTMFSPCWNLAFCREIVRVKCPAFLARKRCWKFGRGCLCDQEMVTRIMSGASLEVIKAPTAMSTRKPPCNRCSIFLEHQSMKFKMLSPLAVPLTIVIGAIAWPIYQNLWAASGARLAGLWRTLSFSATTAASNAANNAAQKPSDIDQYQLQPEQVAHVAQTMLGVLLIFFLLIYIAKFLEWAIIKMNW